jgi:hypothetical protein
MLDNQCIDLANARHERRRYQLHSCFLCEPSTRPVLQHSNDSENLFGPHTETTQRGSGDVGMVAFCAVLRSDIKRWEA